MDENFFDLQPLAVAIPKWTPAEGRKPGGLTRIEKQAKLDNERDRVALQKAYEVIKALSSELENRQADLAEEQRKNSRLINEKSDWNW